MYEGIYDAIHRELDGLEEKYEAGTQLTGQDLERIDTMAHALKCLATYEAMKESDRRIRPVERRNRYEYERRY